MAYCQNWCGILEYLQLAFHAIPASIFNLHMSLFQQDDGYGTVSLDYEDGSKAQWTEDMFRSQIKREIKNRLARELDDPKGERRSWWARSNCCTMGPPGILGIWGEWLFIFRELGSTGHYFQGFGEQAHSFGD